MASISVDLSVVSLAEVGIWPTAQQLVSVDHIVHLQWWVFPGGNTDRENLLGL